MPCRWSRGKRWRAVCALRSGQAHPIRGRCTRCGRQPRSADVELTQSETMAFDMQAYRQAAGPSATVPPRWSSVLFITSFATSWRRGFARHCRASQQLKRPRARHYGLA